MIWFPMIHKNGGDSPGQGGMENRDLEDHNPEGYPLKTIQVNATPARTTKLNPTSNR